MNSYKIFAAILALATFPSQSPTVANYAKDIGVLNLVPSSSIASLARRNEVVESVVQVVPVEMVDNKRALASTLARHPVDKFTTPMAWVRSWSNGVVQDHAVFWHETAFKTQGMPRNIEHPPCCWIFLSHRSAFALLGAKNPGSNVAWASHHHVTARLTFQSYWHSAIA